MCADESDPPPTHGPGKPARPRVQPSLTALYREHSDFVWRFARARGIAYEQLEDVVQDTFLIVNERLATFEGRSTVRTWIAGIALNVCRRALREANKQSTAGEEELQKLETRTLGPDSHAEQSEAAAFLLGVLDGMTELQREAFVLVEVEGVPAVKAAALLETNENTLRTRLRAARAAFNAAVARKHREATPIQAE